MADRKKRQVQKVGQTVKASSNGKVAKAVSASRRGARTQVVSFVDFIRERGVIGLAIGIVIGTAVTKLVGTLVEDVINPLISIFLVDDQLKGSSFRVGNATIGWGNFVSALIDFIVIALTVYIIFRLLRLEKIDKKPASSAPTTAPKDQLKS